jgi:hypothetical protein
MYMNYNHLNTIEEEKHETQNSNYYRDGESEDSKILGRGNTGHRDSKILGELDESHSSKPSPNKVVDYKFDDIKKADEDEYVYEEEEEEEEEEEDEPKIVTEGDSPIEEDEKSI